MLQRDWEPEEKDLVGERRIRARALKTRRDAGETEMGQREAMLQQGRGARWDADIRFPVQAN